MWAANPSYAGQIDDTFTVLEQSANHDVPEGSCGKPACAGTDPYPNYEYGWGYLDALAAVEMVGVGGVGTLEGTVTDGMPMATVPDATIKASLSPTRSWQTTSSPLGLYSMRLLSGTYTVDACKYGHVPAHITGVSVVSGTTTTLNITLPPAAYYIVSGYVTDSATGWPLYASTNIDGYPGDPVWSDPATGYYSVTLAEGFTYTFNVETWVDGYDTASRTVGPLTGEQAENFGLDADAAACTAPGYLPTYAYSEDFETGDGGYTHSGTRDEWEWGTPTVWPNGCASGSNCWGTDLNGNYENYANKTLYSPVIDLSSVPSDTVLTASWWQAWAIESATYDHAYAEVSINGGPWAEMWSHTGGTTRVGWTKMTYDVSSAAGGNVQFRWRLTSDYSVTYEGLYVDDVTIASGCVLSAGGLVVGNAYDGNTNATLTGADVVNDSDEAMITEATPGDPGVDDGFYTLFSPAGTHTFTATMSGYSPAVDTVTIVQSDTVRHDFYLPASHIEVSPTALHYTLELGSQITQTPGLVISNTGAGGLDFELWEKKGDTQPTLVTVPFADVKPLVPPEHREAATTEGLALPPPPPAAILAAGDVIQSWPSGRQAAWGIAYDGWNTTVWIGDGWGSEDALFEYAPDGTPTGRSWPYTWNPASGPADSAFNWNTGMIWTLDVGGDDCIHEMNPATGYTGNTICGPWTISQRGVAYDPETDTWYVGGWNDYTIYHINSSGTLLDSAYVGLGISGLAYNPETRHLFAQVNI
jgi:hypothetical protein